MSQLLLRTNNFKRPLNLLTLTRFTFSRTGNTQSKMSTNRAPSLKGPIHWVLDWDGTITKKDTLDSLVNIAASTKPNFPTQDRWKSVVEAYMSDYTTTLEQLAPGGALPRTIEGESKLLKALKVTEQRSLDRVFESKIFESLTKGALEEGAKKAVESGDVVLRPGCVELLQSLSHHAMAKGDILHIVSVNWSRHFISSCLKAAGAEVDSALIIANELDGITEGKSSSGEISPDGSVKVVASDDKLFYLERIREANSASIVYVGDSWTDIECLLAADLGICIRDEPMGSSQRKLAEALERLNVACPRLADWNKADDSRAVWARDFVEIQEWAKNRDT
jgi:2-hydroxy-3-keto-5-methylthiopentenyl-1-phosphate phosphatase